jgi:hypothetical protein
MKPSVLVYIGNCFFNPKLGTPFPPTPGSPIEELGPSINKIAWSVSIGDDTPLKPELVKVPIPRHLVKASRPHQSKN